MENSTVVIFCFSRLATSRGYLFRYIFFAFFLSSSPELFIIQPRIHVEPDNVLTSMSNEIQMRYETFEWRNFQFHCSYVYWQMYFWRDYSLVYISAGYWLGKFFNLYCSLLRGDEEKKNTGFNNYYLHDTHPIFLDPINEILLIRIFPIVYDESLKTSGSLRLDLRSLWKLYWPNASTRRWDLPSLWRWNPKCQRSFPWATKTPRTGRTEK